MFRRRRPVLRAAAVGGAAYHMGKKMQEGNDAQAELEEQEVGPENEGLFEGAIEQLQQLAKLKDQGVLTQEEFDAQKQKILGMGRRRRAGQPIAAARRVGPLCSHPAGVMPSHGSRRTLNAN